MLAAQTFEMGAHVGALKRSGRRPLRPILPGASDSGSVPSRRLSPPSPVLSRDTAPLRHPRRPAEYPFPARASSVPLARSVNVDGGSTRKLRAGGHAVDDALIVDAEGLSY